jgi:hypothetical protein
MLGYNTTLTRAGARHSPQDGKAAKDRTNKQSLDVNFWDTSQKNADWLVGMLLPFVLKI